MNKKIVWCGINYWDSPFQVSCNHLVRNLASIGCDVLYLNPPISLFSLIFAKNRSAQFCRFKNWLSPVRENSIISYTPLTLLPFANKPFLRSKFALKFWQKFTVPNLQKYIKKLAFDQADILVIDAVPYGNILNILKPKISIMRVIDDLSGFSTVYPALLNLEKRLISNVDHVFFSSIALKDFVVKSGAKSFSYLPHGVNFAHFARVNTSKPKEYESIKGPIAVYVGAMEEWFDYDLINKAAEKLPNINFVLIGPTVIAKNKIVMRKNVHLLGKKDYSELPNFLAYADVGLIPFNRRDYAGLIDGVNPIKLYEYFASGIPCISVFWRGLQELNSPVHFYRDLNDFIEVITNVIKEKPEKEIFYTFAKKRSWNDVTQEFLAEVKKVMESE